MSLNSFAVGVMFTLLASAFIYIWIKPDVEKIPKGEHLYIKVGELNIDDIYRSLNYSDTITYEFQNDLLTFIPIGNNEYKIVSEHATHIIGVFSEQTAIQFFSWIHEYPLPEDQIKYANWYYQEIISEKIWE